MLRQGILQFVKFTHIMQCGLFRKFIQWSNSNCYIKHSYIYIYIPKLSSSLRLGIESFFKLDHVYHSFLEIVP